MISKQIILQIDPSITIKEDSDIIDACCQLKTLNIYDNYEKLANEVFPATKYDDAERFSIINRIRYVCTNITNLTFYVFTKNMWMIDHGLRHLTRDIVLYKSSYGNSHADRKHFIHDVALHLYIDKFTNRLYKYSAINIYNISLDITNGKLREGSPADYTSLTTIHSDPKFLPQVINILKDIFPDRDVYDFALRYMGSLLIPGNKDKIFMIWSGKGNNGKSILARLLELALNEYAIKLPTSTVTGKRISAGSATPEIAMLERRLVAFLQEPSDTEKINIGIVKELTGNDSIYVRDLYGNPRNIEMTAKLIYVANSIRSIDTTEGALWNRIVVMPFNTVFVNNPIFSHERLSDKHLFNKLHLYAPSIMHLLIIQAQLYLKHGLLESRTIRDTTNKARLDNNSVLEYINTDFSNKSYSNYLIYMKTTHPHGKIVTMEDYNSISQV